MSALAERSVEDDDDDDDEQDECKLSPSDAALLSGHSHGSNDMGEMALDCKTSIVVENRM